MPDKVLICEDLWHIYSGKVEALQEANLQVEQGEVLGVIGQNGSGKTTLVKHFNGLLRPSRGRVLVKGVDTSQSSVHELSRMVGYVFQNPNHQLFATTVEEELSFGPRNLGLPPDEVKERVERAIEFFNLGAFRGGHPYRLSFPLRKLVCIASIYTMNPEIFVLDEPTTGQDHLGSNLIRQLIDKLRDDGRTVIIVSHDMRLEAEATDRVVVLWQGRIIGEGHPREVFANDELMQQTNLQPPQITQLSRQLRKPGLPEVALSVAELAEPLAKIL